MQAATAKELYSLSAPGILVKHSSSGFLLNRSAEFMWNGGKALALLLRLGNPFWAAQELGTNGTVMKIKHFVLMVNLRIKNF